MTITKVQAHLLQLAIEKSNHMLDAGDYAGHSEIAKLEALGYVRCYRPISGEVGYALTSQGHVALADWKRLQGPTGWTRSVWRWTRKEYKWIIGVIALPLILWLLSRLFR